MRPSWRALAPKVLSTMTRVGVDLHRGPTPEEWVRSEITPWTPGRTTGVNSPLLRGLRRWHHCHEPTRTACEPGPNVFVLRVPTRRSGGTAKSPCLLGWPRNSSSLHLPSTSGRYVAAQVAAEERGSGVGADNRMRRSDAPVQRRGFRSPRRVGRRDDRATPRRVRLALLTAVVVAVLARGWKNL